MENIDIFLSKLSGYGYGSGSGSGYGYVSGFGYGSGYGSGYGYGYKINSMMIHNIDGINTIINIIKSNIAKGFIVKPDQTLEKTYLVKQNKFFAHGKTLKEALKSLEKKIIANLEPEEVIEKFLDEVDLEKKYTGQYFFDWHGKLTGSCLQGRETFIKNNGIKLTDKYTVFEFIELVKNEFGGEIIKMLEDRIKEVKN